jgi:hypothetical protein
MNRLFLLILFLFIAGAVSIAQESADIALPDVATKKLSPSAQLNFPEINECSGLIRSKTWPDVLWTHNDSGDDPRIFPLKKDGQIIQPDSKKKYKGIQIPDAVNVDWESITQDYDGNLIIGDCGNNSNTRRDLCLYIIREPDPNETYTTSVVHKYFYYYEDQDKFPPQNKNFDCEAIFCYKNHIYLLTKHRSDTFTKLYRLDSLEKNKFNKAKMIERFNIHGQVSDADISSDEKYLSILTYSNIWLFELSGAPDRFFNGKISWLPIDAGQCEAVCFYDNSLLIANEERDLFQIKIDELIRIQ